MEIKCIFPLFYIFLLCFFVHLYAYIYVYSLCTLDKRNKMYTVAIAWLQTRDSLPSKLIDLFIYTMRNRLLILLKSDEIRMYLPFSDGFGTKWNSV